MGRLPFELVEAEAVPCLTHITCLCPQPEQHLLPLMLYTAAQTKVFGSQFCKLLLCRAVYCKQEVPVLSGYCRVPDTQSATP